MESTGATHTTGHHGPHTSGHEPRDVTFRPVLLGLLGIMVLLVMAILLMRPLMGLFAERAARTGAPINPLAESFGRQVPPEPRLQADPLQDLHALRAEEDAVLDSYGWVDREKGIVRIPVSRAMELLVERGLPARQEGTK